MTQLQLLEHDLLTGENPDYYRQQIVTYIGNKRQLIEPLSHVLKKVKEDLGKSKLRLFDGFSGSGIVSRLFKSHASRLVVNDLEAYARVISECFLTNRSEVDLDVVAAVVEKINTAADSGHDNPAGFIERLYSPADDERIQPGERVFYTRENARRLDHYRRLIGHEDQQYQNLLLGPLLSAASVHANTSGVFKGFHKDKHTGVGKFGGSNADALTRIKGQIRLQTPTLSNFDVDVEVRQEDTNKVVSEIGDLDLAYFDPPYNQHPYGSNYFMLNLLVDYEPPAETSRVSGIPTNWNRSLYNKKRYAFGQLAEIVERVDAKYVLLSFNNEGFVSPDELRSLLARIGQVEEMQIKYNTFRGSRNLRQRQIHVTEHLYLVRK